MRAKKSSTPKVALIYDRVNTKHGGAEKVLLALHELYPQAPLFTSVYNSKEATWADVFTVKTSFLQKLPFLRDHHRVIPHLMPLAFETFDLSDFDIVISISSAESKGVITLPHQLHICYLLTPTRYLYSHQLEYLEQLPSVPLIKNLAKNIFKYLEWWDSAAAFRPDVIIPISELVASRTKQYYNRTTEKPIYPPVDIQTPSTKTKKKVIVDKPYFLIVSRLVPYKRIDLAIKACQQLGIDLKIVGEGPDKSRLERLSTDSIQFLGSVSDQQLEKLYNYCTGLLMLGEEDFGITALEVLAHGKPAVVHQKSGVAELMRPGLDGLFIQNYHLEHVMTTIDELQSLNVKSSQLKKQAQLYKTAQFKKSFAHKVSQLWQKYLKGLHVTS